MMKSRIKKFISPSLLGAYYMVVEFFAAAMFGFPGLRLKVIGVTGTKGKSTTVYLLTRILEEAGLRVAASSSIEFRMNKKSRVNELKMALPGRSILQGFLKEAANTHCDYVVLEISSEGLAQHRPRFIHFIAAVFTNLAPEHIESHGSFERYRRAKAILFSLLKEGFAVLNEDDPHFTSFLTIVRKDVKKIFFGKKDFHLIKGMRLKLLGEFNEYNALAAYTVATHLGISPDVIERALERVDEIPGRLEEIKEGQEFRVFLDYAHNPSSLDAVLKACSKLKILNSKLLILTGAQGGGRDKWKRKEMGKIAAQYADAIIITNEDPYQEDPCQILLDIKSGIPKSKLQKSKIILDRKEAIKIALTMAKAGDIVVIAGKGSETVMEVKEGKIPWSDKEIIVDVLTEMSF